MNVKLVNNNKVLHIPKIKWSVKLKSTYVNVVHHTNVFFKVKISMALEKAFYKKKNAISKLGK